MLGTVIPYLFVGADEREGAATAGGGDGAGTAGD